MLTGLELTFMGVTWSNSGLFSTPGFLVSPVGKRGMGAKKKKSLLLASDLSLFLLPSFLPFLLFYYLFPSFPSFFFFFFLSSPLSLFPTGETTKPGVLKRLELDRVTPINVSSRPVSTGD